MNLVRNGKWKGKNGKWYNLSWGGDQWTGSRSEISRRAGQIKAAGQGFFFLGVGLSLVDMTDAVSRGDGFGVVKSGADIGWGAAATFGGSVGLVGGAAYVASSTLLRVPAIDDAIVQPIVNGLCSATGNC